ncbi:MAG: AsmA family protein [Candidatus Omnitrophota bacterium]|nr:AsmA family protein [Candidatus Omnitrophota bacterium]
MKKVRKIILRTILIVILIISAASWYLNNIFLPQNVKAWIVDFLSEKTGRQVRLANVSYNVFKGIALKELTIFEDSGKTNKKFLTAKEIYFKLPLAPLFARKFILSNLRIQSPELTIIRTGPANWNFSTILAAKSKSFRPKFTTLISRATVCDGKISLKDLTKKPEFTARMEAINGEVSLSLPANINFKFDSALPQTPIINVHSSGTYNLLSETLDFKVHATDITLTDYAAYYREAIPVKIIEGKGNLEIAFYLDKDKNVQLDGKSLVKQLTIRQGTTQAAGDLTITTGLAYKIGEEKSLAYEGNLGINNFKAEGLPLVKDLKNINGKILFSKDTLPSAEFAFHYKDTGLKLKARVTDLNRMSANFDLSSDNGLQIKGEFNPRAKDIYSTKIEGAYLDSLFNLTANIDGRKDLLLNIQGDFELELTDMEQIISEYSPELSRLSPKGKLALSARAAGNWNAWKQWSGTIEATSDQIVIKEITFKNLLIDLRMKDKKVFLDKLSAAPYKGILTSTAVLELDLPQPFRLEVDLLNVDLSQMSKDPSLNWQYSSGYISGNLSLEGYRKKPENVTGRGWFKIEEGKLWETPLFNGLANILYFPNLQKILFTHGSAAFTVANQAIRTSDLLLESDGLNLGAKGSIDFNGNLDFKITTELARELAKKSPEFGKIANMIMGGLWNYIIELRLKGTIKEPKYSIIPKFSLKDLIGE